MSAEILEWCHCCLQLKAHAVDGGRAKCMDCGTENKISPKAPEKAYEATGEYASRPIPCPRCFRVRAFLVRGATICNACGLGEVSHEEHSWEQGDDSGILPTSAFAGAWSLFFETIRQRKLKKGGGGDKSGAKRKKGFGKVLPPEWPGAGDSKVVGKDKLERHAVKLYEANRAACRELHAMSGVPIAQIVLLSIYKELENEAV